MGGFPLEIAAAAKLSRPERTLMFEGSRTLRLAADQACDDASVAGRVVGLLDGALAASLAMGPDRRVILRTRRTDILWWPTLLDDRPPPFTLTATAPSRLLCLRVDMLRQLCARNADFDAAVRREAARQRRHIAKVAEREGIPARETHPALARLAQWILLQVAWQQGSCFLRLPIRKQDLAATIDVAPAQLSRLFRELRQHGVTVAGATLHVGDMARLERLAAG